MEGLRHSLLAPAGATVFIIFGTAQSMKAMVKVRYATKDDNGKPLHPHPYAPWRKVDPKYQDQSDKSYRALKMFENVKEWTFMSLPIMWIYAIYAGTLPYVTDDIVDATVIVSSALYVIANHWYTTGYIESAKGRMKGFSLRMKVVQFWLFGSFGVISWATLQRFGVAPAK